MEALLAFTFKINPQELTDKEFSEYWARFRYLKKYPGTTIEGSVVELLGQKIGLVK